jgi:ABC-type phosphate/phosphonate transport system substrate-binding protein
MQINTFIRAGIGLALSGLSLAAAANEEYVFGFPPREAATKAEEIYQPIADYLSQATGKKFSIKPADNWLKYDTEMQKGAYDLVFDGPQFIGWRMAKQAHAPLVSLDGNLVFVVITRKDDLRAHGIKEMAGRRVCAVNPPNLATLTLYSQFDNPARQPFLVSAASFDDAFQGLTGSKCEAAVMPAAVAAKLDAQRQTRTLFTSKLLPNQGFSASPRIPLAVQQEITQALLAPAGKAVTAKLRAEYGNKDLISASRQQYEGLGVLLKDVWGFDL